MVEDEGSEQKFSYLSGIFDSDKGETKIDFNFDKNIQYYLVVEADWIQDVEEKTMTISCLKGTQKIEFEKEKSMTKDQIDSNKYRKSKMTKDQLLDHAIPSILKQNEKQVKSFILYDDKSLVVSTFQMDVGYDIRYFQNNSEVKQYHEESTIPSNTGL